jgi:DNA polymerase elongation subunit (family B)
VDYPLAIAHDGAVPADIPIDTQYYLENQLKQPLTRLFEPVLGEAKIKSLFGTAHCTRARLPP